MTNKAYLLAVAEIGTVEWSKGDNPKVLEYFRDAGHPEVKNDETAWCAAFVGAMLKRAGMAGTDKLTAQSYLKWGVEVPVSDMKQGDICIVKRGKEAWQGHVFFVHKHENGKLWGLGGNQSNSVNIQEFPVNESILGVRRTNTPATPSLFAMIARLLGMKVS
jgi:uncharacterized protein (TIGR02594 family)